MAIRHQAGAGILVCAIALNGCTVNHNTTPAWVMSILETPFTMDSGSFSGRKGFYFSGGTFNDYIAQTGNTSIKKYMVIEDGTAPVHCCGSD